MGKYAKVAVGNKYKLSCGVEVTVIDFENASCVTVVDNQGNTKITNTSQLNVGKVAWPWYTNSRVPTPKSKRLGEKFTLNCGIDVVVCEYISAICVVIEDAFGNKKFTSYSELHKGKVGWNEFEVPIPLNGISRAMVGETYLLKCGTNVEVIERLSGSVVVIQSENGDTKKVSSNRLKNGEVYWKKSRLNKSPEWDQKIYYVYVAKHENEILYIGKGKGNRYFHANNGKSHILELNRLFFSGVAVEVYLHAERLSSCDAEMIERQLIVAHSPKHNYVHNRESSLKI